MINKRNKIENCGCYLCKYLKWEASDYIDSDFYAFCEKREDVEYFKTFPCRRKLKCFEYKTWDK